MGRRHRRCGISSNTLFALTMAAAAGAASAGAGEGVVVHAPKGALAALPEPPARATDYGGFVRAEVTPAQAAALSALTDDLRVIERPYTLRLGGVEFDPAAEAPGWPAGWDADPGGLRLVQLSGPPKPEWLDGLRERGCEIVQHIPPHTYVVWGGADVSDRPGVRWTGAFAPACRVASSDRDLPAAPIAVQVVIVRAGGVEAAVGELEALGGVVEGVKHVDRRFAVARVSTRGDRLRALAHVPQVYAIQPVRLDAGPRGEATAQMAASGVVGQAPQPGYADFLADVGVDGAGVVVAHVDQGVNVNHPDIADAFLPCTGPTCAGALQTNHGTHTAGIIAGEAASGATLAGFLRGQGVAPGSSLIEQTWIGNFNEPGGVLTLIQESRANGGVVSSNSWGVTSTAQGYDVDTMLVDMGVRDADPDAPGDQPMIYVLAVDNGFGGTSSIGAPDEAKNTITVGATSGQEANGVPSPLLDNLAPSTAHGPALDGRQVPHLVAPGCLVDSSALPSTHALFCGTSFSTPHATGAAALFVEGYRGLAGGADPSPALVKAALCASALDLKGRLDADGATLGHAPDSRQGWGRLSLGRALDFDASVYIDQDVVLTETGQDWSTSVAPLDPDQPFRVMLAWTDAPGHGLGGDAPAWNNDLDLVVNVDGVLHLGNNIGPGGVTSPGGVPDHMNNTEGVVLDPPPTQGAIVTVRAADLNSDGVPAHPGQIDQDFALVCLNCTFDPAFAFDFTPEALEVCAPAVGGLFIEAAPLAGFDAPIDLSAAGVPDGAEAVIAPPTIDPDGVAALSLTNTGLAPPGVYELLITGQGGGASRTFPVTLRLDAAPPPAPGLTSPASGDALAPLLPTFEWTDPAGAASHRLQVAADPGFTDLVIDKTLTEPAFKAESPLEPGAAYHWRVRSTNACGDGPFSEASAFTVHAEPFILLVDDDDNAPDVRSAYAEALGVTGWLFDVWDTANSDNEPPAGLLAGYDVVVWFTGGESGGFCGPGAAGEAALTAYLQGGGCLVLSSQDYLFDRGVTDFMIDQLGLATKSEDVAHDSIEGADGGDALFAGFGPAELQFPFVNFSDRISPIEPDGLLWTGSAGDAGIGAASGDGAAVWTGFPIAAIASEALRADLLQRVIDRCVFASPSPCPADLNGDGAVNSSDLNILLASFGQGPGGDIDGDGQTDSTDLNLLLADFGDDCPLG